MLYISIDSTVLMDIGHKQPLNETTIDPPHGFILDEHIVKTVSSNMHAEDI